MNKTLLSLIFLLVTVTGFAQNVKTGIYTTDPQQTLHVAGATAPAVAVGTTAIKLVKPTVMVDGLNRTNNPAHNIAEGTNSLKRVYATQNGDLVLVGSNLEQVNSQQFGSGTLSSTSTLSLLGIPVESLIKAQSFTLTEKSVVNISATLNAQFASLLTDGTAKIYGAYFRFSSVASGSGISTSANFGRTQKSYSNKSTAGTTGDFMISPSADVVLPVGTYTVNLYGYLDGGGALAFTVNFANSTNGENLIITASPTQFQ
jgi:hypothetical protein